MSPGANNAAKRSVLFWVQHLLGIGHLQRALRIADALVERGIAVTIVSGGMPQSLPRDPAVTLVQLPPMRARDASFALIDERGAPVDDRLRERRRDAVLATFAAARPDAIIIEGFPFARRAFRFEIDPLIAASRAVSGRVTANDCRSSARCATSLSCATIRRGIVRSSIASAATSTGCWSMAIPP